ncbi:hypothetical protein [Burkholderia orbicola]|uniref:hypothetical protein n=1 Tax=Burkholderia orbicola TaxID=2978683 RepID=UPI002FE26AF3
MGHYAFDMRPEWFDSGSVSRKRAAKRLVDEWMGAHDVVLKNGAYEALLKAISKEMKKQPKD